MPRVAVHPPPLMPLAGAVGTAAGVARRAGVPRRSVNVASPRGGMRAGQSSENAWPITESAGSTWCGTGRPPASAIHPSNARQSTHGSQRMHPSNSRSDGLNATTRW